MGSKQAQEAPPEPESESEAEAPTREGQTTVVETTVVTTSAKIEVISIDEERVVLRRGGQVIMAKIEAVVG